MSQYFFFFYQRRFLVKSRFPFLFIYFVLVLDRPKSPWSECAPSTHTVGRVVRVYRSTTKLVITRAWGNNRVPISISPRRVLTRFEQFSAAAFVGELSEFFFFFFSLSSPRIMHEPSWTVFTLAPCYCTIAVGRCFHLAVLLC